MAYAIPKQTLLTVLGKLKQSKGLIFSESEDPTSDAIARYESRLKGSFIFHRTEKIGARNPSLGSDALAGKVGDQLDAVVQYINAKLGTGGQFASYAEPADTIAWSNTQAFAASPLYHFNLKNIGVQTENGVANGNDDTFLGMRKTAVRAIVWRAATFHDELWNANGDGATLLEDALSEVLNRRLRAIERMRLQINGGRTGSPSGTIGRGPWKDGSRVRCFEYPYFKTALTNPSDRWSSPPQPSMQGRFWLDAGVDDHGNALSFYVALDTGQMTRFDSEPSPLSTAWIPIAGDSYRRNPAATVSLGTEIDKLLAAKLNVWERAWLYCDHSIAATQLEALKFAMRRPGDNFDNAVSAKQPYVGDILNGAIAFDASGKPTVVDNHILWEDGVAPDVPLDVGLGAFDNALIPFKELQAGDHVILWNNLMYLRVTTGAWRLENALITEIDVVTDNWDELTTRAQRERRKITEKKFMRPDLTSFRLDGFGEGRDYEGFLKALFDNIEGGFQRMQNEAEAAAVTDIFFRADWSNNKGIFVRWAPYSGFELDPWFLFLPRIGSPFPTVNKMLEVIGHSIAHVSRGGGYVAPPSIPVIINPPGHRRDDSEFYPSDGVFFPLHLPVSRGRASRALSWKEFFNGRVATPRKYLQVKRRNLQIFSDVVPGLFVRGNEQPIQIIRPRVRP